MNKEKYTTDLCNGKLFRRLLFLIVIMILSTAVSVAQTYWETRAAGNWNATTVWTKSTDGGTTYVNTTSYPSTTNDIVDLIDRAIIVNLNVTVAAVWVFQGNETVGSLTINSGSTLTLTAGSSGNYFRNDGVVTNNGTITIGTGITGQIYNTLTNNGTITNASSNFALGTGNWGSRGSIINSASKTLTNTGTISVGLNCTFTNNGTFTNTILNVTGTFANSVTLSTNGTITINNGGTYKHMFTTTPGTIPTCTWMTGSTCEIAGYTSSAQLANGLSQSFYHFKWNCPNNSDMTWDLPATFTVLGNLTLTETGSYDSQTGRNKRLNMGYTYNTTVNVSGNMVVEGGTWWGNLSSGKFLNFDVSGNFTQTGGVFFYGTSSSNVFHVAGRTIFSGGTFDIAHSAAGTTMKLDSNLTVSSGGTLTSAVAGNLWLQNSGTQTYTSGGTLSGVLDIFVKSGAILAFSSATETIANSNAGSDFTVESGGGMVITHAGGISTTASTGCIQIGGTRTLSTGGNYTYSTTVAQATGNALPSTVNNFTKSGASTTTLTNNLTISGTASWTAGTFDISGKTLTMNGAIVNTSGTVNCDASSTIAVGGSGATSVLPTISGGTSSITINRVAGVTMGGALTVVNLTLQSGNLDLGANSLTLNGELTNSGGNLVIQSTSSLTFGGSGTAITIPSAVTALASLTVNRTNGVTLGNDLTVSGTLTLTSGALAIGANTLTMNGALTTTSGTLTGGASSNIVFGSGVTASLPAVSGNLNNLTINRANGITLASSLTVGGTLTLTAGALTLGAGNTFTLNGDLSISSGSVTGSTTTNCVIGGSGSALTLPALTLRHLTLNRANGLTLTGNLTVNGDLTLSSGTLTLGSNWIYLYGGLSATGGTIATTSNSSIGVYGGATPANLVLPSNVDSLNNFQVNRTNGVTLGRDLVVKTLLTRTLGSITPNGHEIGYAPSAGLTYGGSMMTQDAEFPAASGPTNLTIGGTDTLHASRTVSGSLSLSSGTLAIGANTLTANGTVSRTSGSFTGGASSNLVLGGAGGNITSFYMATGSSLNNLTINRSGATVHIANPLTVTEGLTLTAGTLNILNSSLVLNGTLSLGSGSLTSSTASMLSIGGMGAAFTMPSTIIALATLTVNRASGVSLSAPLSINVSGTGLTLTKGVLTTTAANILTLASGSTSSAGSDSSFVSGPMAKTTLSTSAFTFPIGKGSQYMPISVTPSTASSTTFKAEYFSTQQTNGNTLGAGLSRISTLEYFDVARTAGTANAYVALPWNAASQIGTIADLRVSRWTGTQWENLGNSATTGTATSGTVKTTTYVTSFGQFTLGSSAGTNPLPVELSSFTARINRFAVSLCWSTATETNNYGFEIERTTTTGHPEQVSPDAIGTNASKGDWLKIGFVEGNGTTNAPKSYSFTDKSANGKISYRLKQIDRDGKFEYSQTVEVTAAATPKEFSLEQNYPNPFNPSTTIYYQLPVSKHVSLKIYDAIGREVATLVNEVKEAGTYSAQFDGAKHSSGIYFAKLSSDGKTQIRKLMLMK